MTTMTVIAKFFKAKVFLSIEKSRNLGVPKKEGNRPNLNIYDSLIVLFGGSIVIIRCSHNIIECIIITSQCVIFHSTLSI